MPLNAAELVHGFLQILDHLLGMIWSGFQADRWGAGQPGAQGAAAGNNAAAAVAAFSQGKAVPGAQGARARRTPEELAASYQV